MDDHMTKAKLLQTFESKRAEWDAALAEVPGDRMTEPGVAGEWSVNDVIAHITYHERRIGDRLHERLRGEVYVPTRVDFMPFDERNDVIFQHNRNRPLPDVLADSRQAYQLLLEGVKAHSEEFLDEWVPWQMIASNSYEHCPQHIRRIRAGLRNPGAI